MFLLSVWDLIRIALTVHLCQHSLWLVRSSLRRLELSLEISSPLWALNTTALNSLLVAIEAFSSMYLHVLPDSTCYPVPKLLSHVQVFLATAHPHLWVPISDLVNVSCCIKTPKPECLWAAEANCSSRSWKCEIRLPTGLGSGKKYLQGCRWLSFHHIITWRKEVKEAAESFCFVRTKHWVHS